MAQLNYGETTLITEAMEDALEALQTVVSKWSTDAQRLISDATRNSGNDATYADWAENAARLYVSYVSGVQYLASTALDGLALIASDEPTSFFSSPPRPFPGGVSEGDKLEVVQAELANGDPLFTPHRHIYVFDGTGTRPIDTSAGSSGVEAGWDGMVRFKFSRLDYEPGMVTMTFATGQQMQVLMTPEAAPAAP